MFRLIPNHLTFVVVPEDLVRFFDVELVSVRVESHYFVSLGYLILCLPAVRCENFGVLRQTAVVPRNCIPHFESGELGGHHYVVVRSVPTENEHMTAGLEYVVGFFHPLLMPVHLCICFATEVIPVP